MIVIIVITVITALLFGALSVVPIMMQADPDTRKASISLPER